jgi:hypothetical protein
MTLYGNSLRDYFATFTVYATATSITLTATVLLHRELAPGTASGLPGATPTRLPPAFLVVLCVVGLWICFQWWIATTGTRLAYRHYRKQLADLQEAHPHLFLPLFQAESSKYKLLDRLHRTMLGGRGATLPAAYAVIFGLMLACVVWPVKIHLYAWPVAGISLFVLAALIVLTTMHRLHGSPRPGK